jgi:hypothetical protein
MGGTAAPGAFGQAPHGRQPPWTHRPSGRRQVESYGDSLYDEKEEAAGAAAAAPPRGPPAQQPAHQQQQGWAQQGWAQPGGAPAAAEASSLSEELGRVLGDAAEGQSGAGPEPAGAASDEGGYVDEWEAQMPGSATPAAAAAAAAAAEGGAGAAAVPSWQEQPVASDGEAAEEEAHSEEAAHRGAGDEWREHRLLPQAGAAAGPASEHSLGGAGASGRALGRGASEAAPGQAAGGAAEWQPLFAAAQDWRQQQELRPHTAPSSDQRSAAARARQRAHSSGGGGRPSGGQLHPRPDSRGSVGSGGGGGFMGGAGYPPAAGLSCEEEEDDDDEEAKGGRGAPPLLLPQHWSGEAGFGVPGGKYSMASPLEMGARRVWPAALAAQPRVRPSPPAPFTFVRRRPATRPRPRAPAGAEVGEWLAALGLEQYRKKFTHHVVNGRLLLALGDRELKAELGIGPLGHRVTLLQGIEELAACAGRGGGRGSVFALSLCGRFAAARGAAVAAGRPASRGPLGGGGGGGGGAARTEPIKRPCSAPTLRARPPSASAGCGGGGACLGPAAGRVTVAEQRAKLLFELSRAQARAAARAGDAARSSEVACIAGGEVAKLTAAVRDLDRRFKAQARWEGLRAVGVERGLSSSWLTGRRAQPRGPTLPPPPPWPQVDHATGTLDATARVPWCAARPAAVC